MSASKAVSLPSSAQAKAEEASSRTRISTAANKYFFIVSPFCMWQSAIYAITLSIHMINYERKLWEKDLSHFVTKSKKIKKTEIAGGHGGEYFEK